MENEFSAHVDGKCFDKFVDLNKRFTVCDN